MGKLKRQKRSRFNKKGVEVRYDDGGKYTFINWVAVVPGVFFKCKPMTITLEYFNEWIKGDTKMSPEEKARAIIAEQLSVDLKKVVGTAHLTDDLGADSLDLIELVMAFEEVFDTEIADDCAEKLVTVDACLKYVKDNSLT